MDATDYAIAQMVAQGLFIVAILMFIFRRYL